MTKDKAKDLVKRKLWNWNYSVKDMTGVPGVEYDLLVESKYMIKVMVLDTPAKEFSKIEKGVVIAAVNAQGEVFYSVDGGIVSSSPGAVLIKN